MVKETKFYDTLGVSISLYVSLWPCAKTFY